MKNRHDFSKQSALKIEVKNVNNKKFAPKLIFFNEKKKSDVFWSKNLSDFCTFWQLCESSVVRNQINILQKSRQRNDFEFAKLCTGALQM